MADSGASLIGVALQDARLFSVWTTAASVLALAAFWRLVHSCFDLAVLAQHPILGRLKSNEGRNTAVLAGHFTTVTNAVVCVAAAIPVARAKLVANDWSLGALLPLWYRPLGLSPPFPGSGAFYLSLAAYCLQSFFFYAVRVAHGSAGAGDRTVLAQRMLLFLVASSLCVANFVPELTLAVLLLEVPSPFVALWQALLDCRARSDPFFGISGCAAVVAIMKFRLTFFGFILVCTMSHPQAGKLSGSRSWILLLLIVLMITYVVHFVRLCREVKRYARDKEDVEALRHRRQ